MEEDSKRFEHDSKFKTLKLPKIWKVSNIFFFYQRLDVDIRAILSDNVVNAVC